MMHTVLKLMGGVVWVGVSASLLFTLWAKHGKDSLLKKAFWSLVVCVPIIGWVFYGGLYKPPEVGPSKFGNGDSGVGATIVGE